MDFPAININISIKCCNVIGFEKPKFRVGRGLNLYF
jgi:hypothetical protein